MPELLQNLIALLLVAACIAYVGWQLFRTLASGSGKAGSCCTKGCEAQSKEISSRAIAGEQFIASNLLRRRRS